MSTPTQTRHPWRATFRTLFAVVVGVSASWAAIVAAAGVDQERPVVVSSIALTTGITRVLALPQVEEMLQRFLPWLAAEPAPSPSPDLS